MCQHLQPIPIPVMWLKAFLEEDKNLEMVLFVLTDGHHTASFGLHKQNYKKEIKYMISKNIWADTRCYEDKRSNFFQQYHCCY